METGGFRRSVDFENAMRERCATSVEPWRFGTELRNTDLPLVYDLNYLRAEGDMSSVASAEIVAEMDAVMSSRGHTHRQIEFEDGDVAERLMPGMAEAGFEAFRALYMTLQREPVRRPELPAAEQVSWEELRPTVITQLRREPFATTEDVVQQLTDRHEVEETATNLRDFGARVDGRIVSYCHLYSDGVVAQIEEVGTLEEFRNRGLASAVVLAASDVAVAEGHELVFLVADDDDWPKALYARLGFDAVGRVISFRNYPKP